ncbi:hypothetical protein F4781DRAFT_434882 [Annulohypoxylon bovei var. microspora]|nr:hypothetical protein F4781DRAFT_434882 [Annulohypoxylon bovei var. microspora]
MRSFQYIAIIIAIASSNVIARSTDSQLETRVTYDTIISGDDTFVGLDETEGGIDKRCSGHLEPGSDCTPGKCDCLGKNGCYSCNGGRTQCQPGPGSGVCWTT